MGLNHFGTDALLRFQLRNKVRQIKADDQMILWEGVDSLTPEELRNACAERGMRATGLSMVRRRVVVVGSHSCLTPLHAPAPSRLLCRAPGRSMSRFPGGVSLAAGAVAGLEHQQVCANVPAHPVQGVHHYLGTSAIVPTRFIVAKTSLLMLRVWTHAWFFVAQMQFDAEKAIQDSISALDEEVLTEAVLEHAGPSSKVPLGFQRNHTAFGTRDATCPPLPFEASHAHSPIAVPFRCTATLLYAQKDKGKLRELRLESIDYQNEMIEAERSEVRPPPST
jgi:hypothetical protein